jgi:hypothetical protein
MPRSIKLFIPVDRDPTTLTPEEIAEGRREWLEWKRREREIQESERELREVAQAEERWRQEQERDRRMQEFAKFMEEAKPRLKAVRTQNELGSIGRKKRAENYEAEPWRVYTRAAAIEATKADPTLSDAGLGRMLPKFVAGPNGQVIVDPDDKIIVVRASGERIEWPHPRTVYRFFNKLREEKILPPLPPRKRK